MFIAINNLKIEVLPTIIELYQSQKPESTLNNKLIKQYLIFCYFINGLWFLNMSQGKSCAEDRATELSQFAKVQWQSLNEIALIEKMPTLIF